MLILRHETKLMELPNEIIHKIVIFLNFYSTLCLEDTCKMFKNEKIVKIKTNQHIFFKKCDIDFYLSGSQMNKKILYEYIDNIEHDNTPNKKIQYINLRNMDTNNTFCLFQRLLLFSIYVEKSQYRNFITFRLIHFFNKFFKKKWKSDTEIGIIIFFNFVKHRDLYNWELSCINLYTIFENINHIYSNNIDLISFGGEMVLTHNYCLIYTIILLNYLIHHVKTSNSLTIFLSKQLQEYFLFESNRLVRYILY